MKSSPTSPSRQRHPRHLSALLPFMAAALLLGCATSSGPGARAATAPRIQHIVYVLQPLDSILLQAPQGPVQTVALDSEGNAVLPGGPTLKLQGKTTAETRALVEAKCKGARVIRFDQFRGERVSILGEVQRPANLPLSDTPMSLMDALASAGGFTSLANTRVVTILRQNADVVQIFQIDVSAIMQGRNVEQNIPLEAGDVVTVARAFL